MAPFTPSRRRLSKALLAVGLTAGPAAAQNRWAPARVDLLLPLSGAAPDVLAETGDMADAARLALDDFGRGSPSPVSLAVTDTRGSPEGAAAGASVARTAGSRLILGPLFAREAVAVGRATPELPVISFSNDRAIGRRGLYVFGFQPETEAEAIGAHARRAGYGALSLFGPAGPVAERVRAALLRRDPALTATTWQPGAPVEAAAQRHVAALLQRRPARTPVVFLALGPEQAGPAADALQRATRPYGPLQLAGGAALGEAVAGNPRRFETALWAAADPAARRGMEERFARRYGRSPSRLAGLGYDAAYLGAVLAAEGRLSVREVERPAGFVGVDGLFRFAPDGVVERSLAVLQTTARGPLVVAPAARAFG